MSFDIKIKSHKLFSAFLFKQNTWNYVHLVPLRYNWFSQGLDKRLVICLLTFLTFKMWSFYVFLKFYFEYFGRLPLFPSLHWKILWQMIRNVCRVSQWDGNEFLRPESDATALYDLQCRGFFVILNSFQLQLVTI